MNSEGFRAKLQAIINEHSMECGSNTPDHLLAKYLAKCLTNFDETVVARDTYYGKRATGISMANLDEVREVPDVNPISPSYEAGVTAGLISGENNPSADLSEASLREQALAAWNGSKDRDEPGAARRLTASFGSRATAPVHVERRRDEFVEGYVHGFVRAWGGEDGAGGSSARKLEPGDVAAAKGTIDALAATRSTALALRADEERDWRTFAFAKTREGSVWERASVQRLFATLDAWRGFKAEADTLRADRDEARKKWQEYEREYVLPCFRWARELGLDLERMVIDSPGHNCVELLVSTLRKRTTSFTDIQSLIEKVAKTHDDMAQRHPSGPDRIKAEGLRRFAEVWLPTLPTLKAEGLR
jgi:hypothetical protein